MWRTTSRATLSKSTLALVVISPASTTRLFLTSVSQATRAALSCVRIASSTASEIWSQTLSGWPSDTDSEVKRKLSDIFTTPYWLTGVQGRGVYQSLAGFASQTGKTDISALLPRQAVEAPAADGAAMGLVVQLALEALGHVIDIVDAGLDQRLAGLEGTYPAAADQHHRRRPARAAQHGLAHHGDEVGIRLPVRLVNPGDINGTRRVPDKQEFHVRAHIHQQRAGGVVEELIGLLGTQGFDGFAHSIFSSLCPAGFQLGILGRLCSQPAPYPSRFPGRARPAPCCGLPARPSRTSA